MNVIHVYLGYNDYPLKATLQEVYTVTTESMLFENLMFTAELFVHRAIVISRYPAVSQSRGIHVLPRGGSVAEWFVRWTTRLAIRVRSRVAAGLPTGYSGLGGNLTGYCCQQYWPRLGNRGGNGTHRGLCWKQVVPSIPDGDFRRLPTLNKRPLTKTPESPRLSLEDS